MEMLNNEKKNQSWLNYMNLLAILFNPNIFAMPSAFVTFNVQIINVKLK